MIPVKDLIGTPYKDHGRGSSGMDCYGLVIEVLRRRGISVPDVFYPDTGNETNKKILKVLEEGIPNTELQEPEEGAVVEILVFGEPSHVGVCLGDGTFIHALRKIGAVIEPLSRYRHKIKGFYRVNN
jgi:cell wall-associated NlpC family hydrolase